MIKYFKALFNLFFKSACPFLIPIPTPIPNNFNGIKVGLERATTYSDWFETVLPGADVKLYDNNESLYLDLQNGRVDVIMTNPMKAYLKFLSKSEGSRFEFKSPVIDEEKFFGIGSPLLLNKFIFFFFGPTI